MHSTCTLEVKLSIRFTLRWADFKSRLNFDKSAPNDPPNHLDIFTVKVLICILHTPPTPKFSSVLFYDELFSSYVPISRKVHRMTQHDLDMFKVKEHTPLTSTFSSVSLYDESFWVMAQFWESAPNDPKITDIQGQKYPITYCIHPRDKISSVSLCDEPFLSYGPILRKVHGMKKWLRRQKYPYACYIHPTGPNVCPFCATMSRFWVAAQFWEKCTTWLQNDPRHAQGQKYSYHIHTTYNKVSSALLYDELWPSFEKVHQMNPRWLWHLFKVKALVCIPLAPPTAIFVFSLYDELTS